MYRMSRMVSNQLPIAVDAMGGDHGSSVVVEGAVAAYKELGHLIHSGRKSNRN